MDGTEQRVAMLGATDGVDPRREGDVLAFPIAPRPDGEADELQAIERGEVELGVGELAGVSSRCENFTNASWSPLVFARSSAGLPFPGCSVAVLGWIAASAHLVGRRCREPLPQPVLEGGPPHQVRVGRREQVGPSR